MVEEKKLTNLICPFMSCRVTQMDMVKVEGKPDKPSYTPTIVRCQEEQCGIYDKGNKVCALLSLTCELIKSGEGA